MSEENMPPPFLRRAKETGSYCYMCIHSKIGKRKTKLLKRLNKDFQSLDLYQESD